MYRSKCGKENPDTATFCSACRNRLSAQTPIYQETQLKKMGILLLIFLTVITGGIYAPVWFLTRRNAINGLQSKEKLGFGVFVFMIVAFGISALLAFISGMMEGANEMGTAERLDAYSEILGWVAAITLLVQCFKVRRIFNEHFNAHLQKGISFSRTATFFFQIFYLQYKINRF